MADEVNVVPTTEPTEIVDTQATQATETTQTQTEETQQTEQTEQTEQKPVYDMKYFSQLDRDTANNKDIMERVKDLKTVSDLTKAYAAMAGKLDNSLPFVDANSSPEEIQAFFDKLGVPKESSAYELTDGTYKPEEIAEVKEFFRNEVLHKNAVPKIQGEKIWNAVVAYLATEKSISNLRFDNWKKSFDSRQNDYLKKDYPVDADRKAAINEDLSLASEFLVESGLGELFKSTGLVYNPEALHKVAQYHKNHTGKGVMGSGNTNKADDSGMFGMSSDWEKTYGGRR